MKTAVLEMLLHRKESETLDFKRQQYKFVGAPDGAKAELVKDILAFANAWRGEDAYILIGIQDNGSARAVVLGEENHLDDASVQQLVNSKTNRPIRFRYEATQIDGRPIGVLVIEHAQERPFFLRNDFGGLKARDVFVRRGSSTDIATPDEIARMGAASAHRTPPTIVVEFVRRGMRLGRTVRVTSKSLIQRPAPHQEFDNIFGGLMASRMIAMTSAFEPRPAEIRKHLEGRAFRTELRFWVANEGDVLAQDARLKLTGPKLEGLEVLDAWAFKGSPGEFATMRGPLQSAVRVHDRRDHWEIAVSIGKLQPKDGRWLRGGLYVGSKNPCRWELAGRIFDDQLPQPIEMPMVIEIDAATDYYDESHWRKGSGEED